jgi:hypothetical protein
MIREEDPRWADALEKKMLTLSKILAWNDVILLEIMTRLQEPILAAALHGLEEPQRKRIFAIIPGFARKRIQDLYETKVPTPGEIVTVLERVISEVRKITNDGPIKMEKIDPEMVVPEDIEEILRKGELPASAMAQMQETLHAAAEPAKAPATEAAAPAPAAAGGVQVSNEELNNLRKKMTLLTNENQFLKQEVAKLTSKLDQVRKAAA